MTERTYGKRYDSKLSSKEIAARIRQDIKNAIAIGKLPRGLKVSVRYDHFSGGTSIDVRITAWPEGFMWLNPEWVSLHKKEPNRYHDNIPRLTEKAQEIVKHLEEIHGAYNHDGSDSMVDHFDVKYYGSVSVEWSLEQPEIERVYEQLKVETTRQQPTHSHLDNISLGDKVIFTDGKLQGHTVGFIVVHMTHLSPSPLHNRLVLFLRSVSSGEEIVADGRDLNDIEIVEKAKLPHGMRIVRFRR